MAVATHDRHARLSNPLFGSDDVDDSLARIVEAIEGYAGFFTVSHKRFDLLAREGIGNS